MSEITSATIAITKEPEAGQMKKKLTPEADPAVLQMYELFLERCTNGTRVGTGEALSAGNRRRAAGAAYTPGGNVDY